MVEIPGVTAGDWHTDAEDPRDICCANAEFPGGVLIARAYTIGRSDSNDRSDWERNGRANARMMAASKRLYAALEEQVSFTPCGPCQKGLIDCCRCGVCKNERAYDALASARGESI